MTSMTPPPDPNTPPGDSNGPPQPGWTPAPLSSGDGAGFAAPSAPSTPGPNRLPSAEIGRYAPRRSLVPLAIAAIGVAVAVVVGYTALHPPVTPPKPTPSHSPSTSAKARDGVPFTAKYDNATGVWKIADSRWDSTGLSVFVVVSVESGELDCYFNALPHDGNDVADGERGTLQPSFPTGPIAAGSSASGWVHFAIEQSTTLVFLRTSDQPQVSGIEVAG